MKDEQMLSSRDAFLVWLVFLVHPSAFILHPCFWRGARVVELAALEML
jgi:hypothetical protein